LKVRERLPVLGPTSPSGFSFGRPVRACLWSPVSADREGDEEEVDEGDHARQWNKEGRRTAGGGLL